MRCRLERRGRRLATATRALNDGRAVMRLEAAGRLEAGGYTLVVTAIGTDGRASSERKRVTVR